MMRDEGPSPDDIDRFGGDDQEAYCPRCGAVVWDDAEFCPSCGDQISGRTSSKPPVVREMQRRWMILVAIFVLISFLWWLVRIF
ncbi:MAG: zinc ribbon domain-containing protein [Planctomycetota bacterium]|nr:zinc ribbon domain-containing protein [Planctomycetota bacterium]